MTRGFQRCDERRPKLLALALVLVLPVVACTRANNPSLPKAPVAAGQSGASATTNAHDGAGAGGGAKAGSNQGAGGTGSAGVGTGGSTTSSSRVDAGMQPAAHSDAGADAAPASGGDASSRPTHSTGPGDWKAGDYPPDISSSNYLEISGLPGQNGHVRQYKVHLPPSYDPQVPAPVVFCIHGLGQDAVLFCVTGAAMDKKSDAAGFAMIMPNGYNNSWNAGTCCGDASTEMLDDVALFRAIFEEVGKHVNIDLDRVYATGLSNGAYMSYRLACAAADIFTAVAPGAGAIGKNDIGGGTNPSSDFTACEPSRPVSVLDMHGTNDMLIAYDLQKKSLDHMASKIGCGMTTSPAAQPKSGGDTTCVSYDGCPSGIELVGCTVQGGGHCWFGSPDCGTGGGDIGLAIVGNNSDTLNNNDAAWDFFKRLSR